MLKKIKEKMYGRAFKIWYSKALLHSDLDIILGFLWSWDHNEEFSAKLCENLTFLYRKYIFWAEINWANCWFSQKNWDRGLKDPQFTENIWLIHNILHYNQSYNLTSAFCQIFSANSNIFWELGSQDPPLFPREDRVR